MNSPRVGFHESGYVNEGKGVGGMKRGRNVFRFIVTGVSVLEILCLREGVSLRLLAIYKRQGKIVEGGSRELIGCQLYDRDFLRFLNPGKA